MWLLRTPILFCLDVCLPPFLQVNKKINHSAEHNSWEQTFEGVDLLSFAIRVTVMLFWIDLVISIVIFFIFEV
ncbi:hypothetical protein QVD17_40056 [Tagetes erecta]|uniref:Uncharacterized protein n=1 Tax=Tagetes erecta TaxID=13708 RepID=A0AAD8NHQ3_TARER|nr:hypothetical protein QVD17_40056 [Tagetes erecta]